MWKAVNYTPSREQRLFHEGVGHHEELDVTYKLATGGEQAGKSYSAAMELFSKCFHGSLFWVVAPQFDQARPEMRYLAEALQQVGAIASVSMPQSPGPWTITTKWGARIRTLSAEDVQRIANEAPDGILMVEAAQQPEEAFFRCLGRTGPNDAWLCINGTLEGSTNWFASLYKHWSVVNQDGGMAFRLPAWSNLAKYPGGEQDPKILKLKETLPDYVFQERFAGLPVPPKGLVHPDFDLYVHLYQTQFGGTALDPRTIILPKDAPLQLWIDPGWAHKYAVEAACLQSENVHLVDELYTEYLNNEEVIDLCTTRPWWPQVELLVTDISAERHADANKSAASVWRAKTGLKLVNRPVSVQDGIIRTSTFLRVNPLTGMPRMTVSPKCKGLIQEYTEGYKRKLGPSGEVLSENPRPLHDDAAKAVAYGLVWNYGLVERVRQVIERQLPAWKKRKRTR